MKKHTKVMLSLLVICMLISAMPGVTPVVAAEADDLVSDAVVENSSGEAVETDDISLSDDISILVEDVTLRGEYEKHFLMSDGTYQVALYNEPVHQLEDGEWVEIDNTLSLQTVSDGTARYSTANGLSDVSFAQALDDRLVTMRQDDYSVSWGVQAVSGNQSTGAVTALTYSESYATITGTCSYGTVQFKVYVLPVPDGTYFIKSRAYNKYLQVDYYDIENDYSTSGATMMQWEYCEGDHQEWEYR